MTFPQKLPDSTVFFSGNAKPQILFVDCYICRLTECISILNCIYSIITKHSELTLLLMYFSTNPIYLEKVLLEEAGEQE